MNALSNILLVSLLILAASASAFVQVPSDGGRFSPTALSMSDRAKSVPKYSGKGSWDRRWEDKYRQVQAHLKAFGPNIHYRNNPRLWEWLHIQKENLRRNVVNQERRDKLAALEMDIDMEPNPMSREQLLEMPMVELTDTTATTAWERRWDEMYEQLKIHYQWKGHANVSVSYDAKLANWVAIQKENMRRGAMKADRRGRLMELGVVARE